MILRFKAVDKDNHQIATVQLIIRREVGEKMHVKAVDSSGNELYQQLLEKEHADVTDLTVPLNQALTKLKQIHHNPSIFLISKIG